MKVKRWKLFSLAGVSAGILVASVALAAASGNNGSSGNGGSTNSAASSVSTSSGGAPSSQSSSGTNGGAGHSTNAPSGSTHGATSTADRPATSSHGTSGANGLFTSGVPSSCGKGNGGPCPPPTGPPNGPPTIFPVFSIPPITTTCGKLTPPCPVGPNGYPPYPPPLFSTNASANDVLALQPNETTTYNLGGFAPGSTVTFELNGQHEATSTANGEGNVLFTASSAGSSVSINGGPAISNTSNSYAGSASDGSTSQGFTLRT